MQTRAVRCLSATIKILLLLPLLLWPSGCQPQGDAEDLKPVASSPSVQSERQAVESLVQRYADAVQSENIDQVQDLLAPTGSGTPRQRTTRQTESMDDTDTFRQDLSTRFRQRTLNALSIPSDTIEISDDRRQVRFVEVESLTDPNTQSQVTQVYRSTFALLRSATSGGGVRFRIEAVQRQGPLVEITTPGQVQAGALARIEVRGSADLFPLSRVETVDDGSRRSLRNTAAVFDGTFTAPIAPSQTLQVHLYSRSGEELAVTHQLQVRGAADGVVQRVSGTASSRLYAVTVAADGTVWAGGDTHGSLYRVRPGDARAEFVAQLALDPEGRIEDLVLDERDRLQAVVFSPRRSGVIVHDQGTFCQTVNVVNPTYPLRTPEGQASPGTRAIRAGAGAIWLHGSDGGIARVVDGVRDGVCPSDDTAVQYATVLHRDDGTLPTNTVPALLAQADGTLWVGSALGLLRLKNGDLTPVPFDPELRFTGDPATLEAFFQEVAQAILEAEPIEAVSVGDVSFTEAFGQPLVKEDLIFSLAEDAQGRIWVGTLGGGLRRIEVQNDSIKETLHLTRQDGLASNIIFALATGPDGSIWAATDDGVSRIQDTGETPTITTFTAVDGLSLPVRDLAVDATGTVWVATDGGLYRIDPQGVQINGTVQDDKGNLVAGAEVVVLGTALRATTNTEGRFTLSNVPSGSQRLQVDGHQAEQGLFSVTFRDVVVARGTQTLTPVAVTPGSARVPVASDTGGTVRFPLVPGATVEMAAGATQFPDGTASELALTLLPPTTLATPLPRGFTAVAAAKLEPDGITFTTPARITLPTQGQVTAGQLVILPAAIERYDENLRAGGVGTGECRWSGDHHPEWGAGGFLHRGVCLDDRQCDQTFLETDLG